MKKLKQDRKCVKPWKNWQMTDWINSTDLSTGGISNLTFDTANSGSIRLELPDVLINWLPKACTREKYLPTWHLVRSYA